MVDLIASGVGTILGVGRGDWMATNLVDNHDDRLCIIYLGSDVAKLLGAVLFGRSGRSRIYDAL